MEENKKSSKTWLVVVLILVLVGALCISGYYIYTLNEKVTALEGDLTKAAAVIREINEKAEETSSSEITQNEVSKNELNKDFMDKVFKRLNFVQTLEFTNTNKITEKEIHDLLIEYFSVNNIADASKYSQAEIKQLVKDILNKDYSGNFNLEAEAAGECMSFIAITAIEKESNNYTVAYAVINDIDADAPDDISGYYEAKLDKNLTFISNKKINK